MLTLGLLWYDDDARRPVGEKIADAVARYRERIGGRPTVCQLNPRQAAMLSSAKAAAGLPRLRIVPDETLGLHHFLVGIEDDGGQRQMAQVADAAGPTAPVASAPPPPPPPQRPRRARTPAVAAAQPAPATLAAPTPAAVADTAPAARRRKPRTMKRPKPAGAAPASAARAAPPASPPAAPRSQRQRREREAPKMREAPRKREATKKATQQDSAPISVAGTKSEPRARARSAAVKRPANKQKRSGIIQLEMALPDSTPTSAHAHPRQGTPQRRRRAS